MRRGIWAESGLQGCPRGIREAEALCNQRVDVFSLQKVPRCDPGWPQHFEEGWTVVSHREPSAWRGCGVCFRSGAWTVVQRKASSRGIWCKLRKLSDGVLMWVGSVHITQNAAVEVHAEEVEDFVRQLPKDIVPVLVGMDVNTPIKWIENGVGWEAVGKEGKGEHMVSRLLESDIVLTAPPSEQKSMPTCRPRKQDVQGRHIDVVGGSKTCRVGLGIVEGSYMFVGSDHDMVLRRADFATRTRKVKGRPSICPKRVKGDIVIPSVLNQDTLKGLALQCTEPYARASYRDPQHVKVYFQVARRSKQPEDWRRALRERSKARSEWQAERVRDATSANWQAYRDVSKKGHNGWESHLAAKLVDQGTDPHAAVHQHFTQIYAGSPTPPFPFLEVPRAPDFSFAELQEAIAKGKNGKSTGEDGVPHELLVAISKSEEGETKLLEWFNRLLHGEEPLPRDWGRAVMVLLPKCSLPEHVKQLRPICVGSAANKVFARMLLARSRPAFQYSTPLQNMGEGRQTVDHIWTIARLLALEQEWRYGLTLLKLDIEKAFDSLDRGRFLQRLQAKMGCCEELRCWWQLFEHTEAGLSTAWGESTIPMSRGIRQGSVESPQVFSTAMEWIVKDVAEKHGWDPKADVYEGMGVSESAFDAG